MKKFLVLGAFGFMALGLAACQHALTSAESQAVELGAVKYAMAANATFVSCSGIDSDGDSYVTCTIKDTVTASIKEVACSYDSPGCKQK